MDNGNPRRRADIKWGRNIFEEIKTENLNNVIKKQSIDQEDQWTPSKISRKKSPLDTSQSNSRRPKTKGKYWKWKEKNDYEPRWNNNKINSRLFIRDKETLEVLVMTYLRVWKKFKSQEFYIQWNYSSKMIKKQKFPK